MAEPHFDHYRIGIQKLLEAIGPENPSYTDVLTYQHRLEENLISAYQFGDTPSLKAERARIIDGCNRLSLSVTGHFFYHFCGLPENLVLPRLRADELHHLAFRHQLEGDLGYALQLYRQVQQVDPTYPRIDARIAAVQKEMQAPYVDPDGHVRSQYVFTLPSPSHEPTLSNWTGRNKYIVAVVAVFIFVILGSIIFLLGLWPRGGFSQGPTETPAKTPTRAPAPTLADTWARPADEMVMVYVPAGEFDMGSTEGDPDEQPVHTVALDAFWIDRTEVTNAQYALCVGDSVCDEASFVNNANFNGDDYPVVGVSWYDAETYCEWADARLPTEAEWEYAARGPEGHTYPWGNEDPACDLAQYGVCSGRTVPVGSLSHGASWCGALDLAGNVWEWVADLYDGDYYERSPTQNPLGPEEGNLRVLRGGSWFNSPGLMRGVYRYGTLPDGRFDTYGFRCARGSE